MTHLARIGMVGGLAAILAACGSAPGPADGVDHEEPAPSEIVKPQVVATSHTASDVRSVPEGHPEPAPWASGWTSRPRWAEPVRGTSGTVGHPEPAPWVVSTGEQSSAMESEPFGQAGSSSPSPSSMPSP